jgi:hypothetical protein
MDHAAATILHPRPYHIALTADEKGKKHTVYEVKIRTNIPVFKLQEASVRAPAGQARCFSVRRTPHPTLPHTSVPSNVLPCLPQMHSHLRAVAQRHPHRLPPLQHPLPHLLPPLPHLLPPLPHLLPPLPHLLPPGCIYVLPPQPLASRYFPTTSATPHASHAFSVMLILFSQFCPKPSARAAWHCVVVERRPPHNRC